MTIERDWVHPIMAIPSRGLEATRRIRSAQSSRRGKHQPDTSRVRSGEREIFQLRAVGQRMRGDRRRALFTPIQFAAERLGFHLQVEHHRDAVGLVAIDDFGVKRE